MSQQLTRPRIYRQDGDRWVAEMVDEDGTVWGQATASTRNEALVLARKSQPRKAEIRERRKVNVGACTFAGGVVGGAVGLCASGRDASLGEIVGNVAAGVIIGATVFGIGGYVASKLFDRKEE